MLNSLDNILTNAAAGPIFYKIRDYINFLDDAILTFYNISKLHRHNFII